MYTRTRAGSNTQSYTPVRRSLQVLIEPGERALQRVLSVARLAQAVALARVAHEDRVYAAPPQRHVHLFGLRDVHVVILLAVDEERRRLHLPGVADGRPALQQVVVVP